MAVRINSFYFALCLWCSMKCVFRGRAAYHIFKLRWFYSRLFCLGKENLPRFWTWKLEATIIVWLMGMYVASDVLALQFNERKRKFYHRFYHWPGLHTRNFATYSYRWLKLSVNQEASLVCLLSTTHCITSRSVHNSLITCRLYCIIESSWLAQNKFYFVAVWKWSCD